MIRFNTVSISARNRILLTRSLMMGLMIVNSVMYPAEHALLMHQRSALNALKEPINFIARIITTPRQLNQTTQGNYLISLQNSLALPTALIKEVSYPFKTSVCQPVIFKPAMLPCSIWRIAAMKTISAWDARTPSM